MEQPLQSLRLQLEDRLCAPYLQGRVLRIEANVDSVPKKKSRNAPDTVVAIDLFHSSDGWQEKFTNWSRMINPSGRVIFNLCTREHILAGSGNFPSDETNYPAITEIIACGERLGLNVEAILPYGVFLDDEIPNYWADGVIQSKGRFAWKRLLSWHAGDAVFFDFMVFLHRIFITHLPCQFSERAILVFSNAEKQKDKNAEAPLELPLSQDIVATIAGRLNCPVIQLKTELLHYMENLRCKVLFYYIWRAVETNSTRLPISLGSIVGDELANEFREWSKQDVTDERVLEIAQTWYKLPMYSELTTYKGVALGAGLEYQAMIKLLDKKNNIFDESGAAE